MPDQTVSTPQQEVAKAYSPRDVEDKWYSYWERNKLFHANVNKHKKPYTIVIPPPNITGILTMGHILNNTIQDVFIRWKRMQGSEACWVPGTDHAGIATEVVVQKTLSKENLSKRGLGRGKFLERVWEWRNQYGTTITKQLRKLGVSCDWERERFTMDEGLSNAVKEVFVRLFEKGLVYKGKYIVNWCPKDHTAISDDEVIYREHKGHLWFIKYPLQDSSEFITIATTRPETMLGDTAIAVNSKDERFQHLIGKNAVLPIVGRPIPIITDDFVDPTFGTGMVKVTPAHDPNDFQMALRHNLEQICVMDTSAKMNENAPSKYRGLDRYECRKKLVKDLEEQGYLLKTEDYVTSIGEHDRCHTIIEPYLSDQWFVRMKPLAEPALKVVQEGKIKFYPERWVKTYEHWMENIRDWCISRQLWWGHRIPIYYCDDCGNMFAAREQPGICPKCRSIRLRQDENVLDTWFSSWLWPFSTLGWPEKNPDLEYFYPTDLLVTAPDIIFFWVARMIMAGLEFMGEIPFSDVYFTSIIRDEQGRKMSKSLGNSPDPLDVIAEYGADALRFTVIYLAPVGQDVLYSNAKVGEIGQRFANKIWNAGRFLLMNQKAIIRKPVSTDLSDSYLDLADRWILSRLHSTIRDFDRSMENFRVNDASKMLYDFIWHDYCDWYVEMIKNRLYKTDDEDQKIAVISRAITLYEEILKLLHPFMPFVTEELWQNLKKRNDGQSISIAEFPAPDEKYIDDNADQAMNYVQDIIVSIRTIRSEMDVPPGKPCAVVVNCHDESHISILNVNKHFLEQLAKVNQLTAGTNLTKPELSSSAVVKGDEVFVPLKGLIDIEVEKARLEKEIARIEGMLESFNKKLSNPQFLERAPKDVVEKEQGKQEYFRATLEKLHSNLKILER
jgi:valyl-tRNA synthetase